ncbi:MAG: ABC transporter substrate-binding protein, partial [Proteobacteria bacterium]|nr:ABC transporter substrate-binding protein [Pseudomonadota bacterium]
MKTASLALTRRLAAPVFGAVLAAIAQSPAAADAAGAEAFVRALADDAIAILTDPALTDEALTAEFRAFVAAGFDVPVVARFALGPYWRAASEAQRAEYLEVFFDYIVDTYAVRFRQFSVLSLEVGGTREINESETIVSSVVVRPEAENIAVDWHVRNATGNEYRIIDILFEGLRLGL